MTGIPFEEIQAANRSPPAILRVAGLLQGISSIIVLILSVIVGFCIMPLGIVVILYGLAHMKLGFAYAGGLPICEVGARKAALILNALWILLYSLSIAILSFLTPLFDLWAAGVVLPATVTLILLIPDVKASFDA
ncbi:MAG: hypothetical protein KAJ96_00910 [Candidatus Thorarchaeota archaeon]|nr:hypothetical protein [Candidatus Thorarchaeota archaeon]